MAKLFEKLKKNLSDASPELMAKAAELADKGMKAAVDLSEKAQPHLDKAKTATGELVDKASPIIKNATETATHYAQENAPILKQQVKQVLGDAIVRREALKREAENDKAKHKEYIRTMYDIELTPESPDFIEERFYHLDDYIYFMPMTGKVLDTDKRSEFNIQAGASSSSSSFGYMYKGSGFSSMNISASSYVSASTTTAHEFWIELPNGLENPIYLSNSSIPLRTGQMVTLLFAVSHNSNNGKLIGLYNHNAKSYWPIMSAGEINHYFDFYTEQPGMFNKKEVANTRERLLAELNIRTEQLSQWIGQHALQLSTERQAAGEENPAP